MFGFESWTRQSLLETKSERFIEHGCVKARVTMDMFHLREVWETHDGEETQRLWEEDTVHCQGPYLPAFFLLINPRRANRIIKSKLANHPIQRMLAATPLGYSQHRNLTVLKVIRSLLEIHTENKVSAVARDNLSKRMPI